MRRLIDEHPYLMGLSGLVVLSGVSFYLWRNGMIDYWFRKRATKKLFKKYRDQRGKEEFHERYRG